uniref:metallophosphoesterase n=1 Tax=Parerythrobacter lutipelagi TaxID=1964208 RepID=UPI0010F841DE|nr:metallophosphoesterase [Parerythrobacter lutipelagi]
MSSARIKRLAALIRLTFAAVAAALCLAVPATAIAQEEPRRIVAIGDLHGDFEAWQRIARAAGLIDEDGNWTGGDTALVQLGDITDRGPDSLKIIRHLQELETAAPQSGGQVIVLLGNHEAMNVSGDLRYVHPGEYAAFADNRSAYRRGRAWRENRTAIEAYYASRNPPVGADEAKDRWYAETPLGAIEHRAKWSPGGELGQWSASRPAVVKLGGVLFVHGGLSAERGLVPVEMLNAQIAAALAPGNEIDRTILEDPLGPLWYRGHVMRGEGDSGRVSVDDELAQILAYHGARRLVVGHTPSIGGIAASHDGRLIRADTGISAHYGGPPSYLELIGGKALAHRMAKDGQWSATALDDAKPVISP